MGRPLVISLRLEAFDKITKPLKRAHAAVDGLGLRLRKLQATSRSTVVGMSSGFKGLVSGIIGASIAYAIYDKAILGTIKRGARLEDQLVRAGAKFGKLAKVVPGTTAFAQLEKAALKAGLTTEFTAFQSAQALTKLAAAGLTVSQSIATLPGIIDFATASGLQLEAAASMSADAVGAMGGNIRDMNPKQLKAKMDELNDVMVISANTFNMSTEEMFQAMTKAGRVTVGIMGASSFEFATFIGNIANVGVKGEIAGRGFRSGMLSIVTGAGAAGKELKKMGVHLTDSTGKFRNIISIMKDLRNGLMNVQDEAERLRLIKMFTGKVGIVQLDAILSRTEEQMRNTTDAMKAQRGEVKRIANLIRSTLTGRWIKFNSAMEGLGLIIFDKIKPGLKSVVTFLHKTATALAKASDPLSIIIPLMIKMTLVTKAFSLAQSILNGVLFKNPILSIISAIIILTTLYPDLIANNLEWIIVLASVTLAISLSVKAIVAYRIAMTSSLVLMANIRLGLIAQEIWIVIVTAKTWLLTASVRAFGAAMLLVTAHPIVALVTIIIGAIILLITHWDEVVDLFSSEWFDETFLQNPFVKLVSFLGGGFLALLSGKISKIAEMVSLAFGGIGDFFSSLFGDDKNIDLDKTEDLNINNNIDDIIPSPSAASFGNLKAEVDINFNNKPEDVEIVTSPDLQSNLKLMTSGT